MMWLYIQSVLFIRNKNTERIYFSNFLKIEKIKPELLSN